MQDAIVGQVFDTTASNTDRQKETPSRIEIMLNRPILWLACKHHRGVRSINVGFFKHAD